MQNPWYERAFVIFAITILLGVIGNLYSKLELIETNLSHCCQKEDHSAIWHSIKENSNKHFEIALKIKELEIKILNKDEIIS